MEIQVAVPAPVDQTYTYSAPADVARGVRVLVPFGGRAVVGVCLGMAPELLEGRGFQVKPVKEVLDHVPVYSEPMLRLAQWISQYYCHPLGEVLRAMLPASAAKQVRTSVELTKKGVKARSESGGVYGRILAEVFAKKTQMTIPTLRKRLSQWQQQNSADWLADFDLPRLLDSGLLTKKSGSLVKARRIAREDFWGEAAGPEVAMQAAESPRELSRSQQNVYENIVAHGLNTQASKPFLLWGVTGAGKTEVYLHLIQNLLSGRAEVGSQALVLVPEISLTPQMTRVFTLRFPGQVAVVHSAMTDKDRWQQLQRIRTGEASILIGPRSAVFGPFRQLRLVIVDEEHDGSYKQATGLTYNGRDVAVLRAQFEGATVVLGSATPSLESYANALHGKYHLLRLPDRVSGRPLPNVEVLESKPAYRSGRRIASGPNAKDIQEADIPVHARVLQELRENLALGQQAMVIVNRRGYAYYLFSLTERRALSCPECSISMTLHKRSTLLRCHYCDFKMSLAEVLRAHPEAQYVAVGYGSEQAEEFLRSQLPGARIARLDSDVAADRTVLPETLGKFRAGEIDILVGTQMLAKGHDFPNVTLIVLLEVDQQLDLPDFRAGERTFQLIVQAAGRAGRAELPGRVLVQTHRGEHPVIIDSIRQDYEAFAQRELTFRQAHIYPPFGRLVYLEITSVDRSALDQFCQRLQRWLDALAEAHPEALTGVRLLGPSVPAVEIIRGRHRRTLLLSAEQMKPLIGLVNRITNVFDRLPADLRLRIDVDPQTLM